MAEEFLQIEDTDALSTAFGTMDENLQALCRKYGVEVSIRDSQIKISGEEEACNLASRAIRTLLDSASRGMDCDSLKTGYILDMVSEGKENEMSSLDRDVICVNAKGKPIRPKTLGQSRYVRAISRNTVTIGVGPAGTGKTYLAVAAAVTAYREKQVSRIILTRPAVEAGERLGFLPGDLQNKVDPYLRPLYDALYDMFGAESFQKLSERGDIEVAPLAYMRGRTLDESFIILDEAQNTTREQMKMFLTRLGFGSKIVITGDITQIDLPRDQVSGLIEAMDVLQNVEDISIRKLTAQDVVRHRLVQQIVAAYDSYEGSKKEKNTAPQKKGKYHEK